MHRTLHLLLALLGTAAIAAAVPQLDLPKKRKLPDTKKEADASTSGGKTLGDGQGDVSSRTTTDKVRSEVMYDAQGRAVGKATTTKLNTAGSGGKRAARGKLVLPAARRDQTPPASAPGAASAPAAAASPSAALAPTTSPRNDGVPTGFPSARNSARFLYDQLLKANRPGAPEVAEAADRLARLGEDGLDVARFALRQDSDVMVYAGSRALLAGGTADDADDVVRLLRGTMPGKVAPLVLEQLLEHDPVRGNKKLLAELLRHDSGPLRRAAKRLLRGTLESDDALLLVPALEDRATDVRRAAVELLAGLEGPLPTELLIDRVTDRSSSVSQIAIRTLKKIENEEIDRELLRRVMESREILRREALLLIAIVEREDRLVRPILGLQHTAPLVAALRSPLPLAQSAAAIALAGVGFRSPKTEATAWMDGPVPSTLVGVAAGFTFFDGFELVRDPGMRRLRQITGVSHGSDGPAWARWWSSNKAGFRASRAVISVGPEDELRIVIAVKGAEKARPFALVGPALAGSDDWFSRGPEELDSHAALSQRGDVVFLTSADAIELCGLLREEGVFGAERLPGPRGAFGLDGRSVDVTVGGRSKSFRFASDRTQPWFERVLARTQGLRQRNAWQRFPVAGEHEDQRALFLAESPWCAEPHDQAERDAHLKDLLVRYVVAAAPADRTPALEELERLRVEADVIVVTDIPVLLDLLVQEPRFNTRSRLIVGLLREANSAGSGELSGATAERIVNTLHDRFGPSALTAMSQVISGQGRDAVIAAAVDERGLLRVAAAEALAKGEEDQDIDLLIGLLGDSDQDVQLAAVRALGRRGQPRARRKVLDLAASGPPRVRIEALRAIGSLGGPGAIDVLVSGLTDQDERYHLPAAEGLSRIDDEGAAPLLVSLLRGKSRPAIRDAARQGLLRLGEGAHNELFSAMRSPDGGLRREAALILAEQLEPRSIPVLVRTLAKTPEDEAVGQELVVLTCVDFRDEPLPADRWFQWWDEVDRRDSFSWFLAALERRNLRAPARDAFSGAGTHEARVFLLSIISELGDPLLSERALRELERLHGSPLGPLPMESRRLSQWLATTQAIVAPAQGPPGSR